ncbi:MAG: tRNA (adenosine(37)-N6)-threonylcarbamoyltransferase complex dimerization subunit type 1 TsaB [Alphaproteobacteria bacterium]|uniref:tRNA (Adenosine(37)-N6)-threonylcarbamoyltransferase complex dimerization subunit type 1 TsaB n=1 Tax=Candidatus Nitrobium versatile TaxID=2884831 RepID=A0A953M2V7_9BACT|nr:tRNA (adenosine(37)-N6)-threonylcarbamoyltransferase complex dimerization subunit type 1 TsaB [Candidatus Nitrobium versatile]
MKLLAIETSTMLGGVALMEDSTLVAEMRMNIQVTHSERILTGIDHLLRHAGFGLEEIDVFGIAIGPGSFTGLRVGLSTLKGLVYASGKPLVSVPTLEAFAWNLPFAAHPVCPLLDARKREVYAGVFIWNNDGFTRLVQERAVRLEDLLAALQGEAVFIGEGAVLYRDTISRIMGSRAHFGQPQDMVPSPANVACLCMRKAERGEFDDPVRLSPLYLRRSEAEIKMGG